LFWTVSVRFDKTDLLLLRDSSLMLPLMPLSLLLLSVSMIA
jgi:hypothetical protein